MGFVTALTLNRSWVYSSLWTEGEHRQWLVQWLCLHHSVQRQVDCRDQGLNHDPVMMRHLLSGKDIKICMPLQTGKKCPSVPKRLVKTYWDKNQIRNQSARKGTFSQREFRFQCNYMSENLGFNFEHHILCWWWCFLSKVNVFNHISINIWQIHTRRRLKWYTFLLVSSAAAAARHLQSYLC